MKSVTFENLKKQNYTMKESLRALKTNIQFCGDDICTIVVTSAMPNEGKSTVTMDLARSFSESGKRVLLIDTDMRKSVYVGRLRAVASDGREIYGLSHFLSGQRKLEDVLYGTTIPGLFMIFAGPSVPNPTEILEKKYFTELLNFAKEHFDYVLLDCAPIGAAIDAAVIAKHCDGAILVIAQGMASGRLIQTVKKQMEAGIFRLRFDPCHNHKCKNHHHHSGHKIQCIMKFCRWFMHSSHDVLRNFHNSCHNSRHSSHPHSRSSSSVLCSVPHQVPSLRKLPSAF